MYKELKPFIVSLLIVVGFVIGIRASAAPTVRYEQHIYPFFDSAFDLGTSTKAWSGITTDKLWGTTLSGFGTRCVQVDNNGLFAVASAACGSGSGGGGGLASTSPWVANTWVYAIDNSTVGASSTPYFSAFTATSATSTNFAITGLAGSIPYSNGVGSLQPLLIGSNLTLSNGTLSATGGSSFAWPFTKLSTNEQATSTTLSLLAGLTSASTTFTGDVTIVPMTSALLQTGAGGLIAEYAGTSCTNQFPRSISALGIATCATVASTDVDSSIALSATTITVAGTANQITSSAGAQSLAANRTWTLSLSNPTVMTNSSSTLLSTTIASTSQLMLSGKKDAILSVDANGWVVASSTIGNNQLQNSTISGIALGGTLNALTATNGSLTFSGSYDGSTARTVGLNVGNANNWTALQTFTNASSTLLSSTIASTSQLILSGFNCTTSANGGALTTDANGRVSCSDDDSGGGGGLPWMFTKQGDGFQATSTGMLFTGGLVVSGTASTTFQQPIIAPNVATTTVVQAQYCNPNSNNARSALAGNSFFASASMTNNVVSLSPLVFATGTTSQATCLFVIPRTTASTTITTFYTSTSTTAGHDYAVDLSVYTANPYTGSLDPTDGVKTWLLNGSTTPSQRMAVRGVSYGSNATTTKTTLSMPAGNILMVIYDAYLADADDTASSDFILPLNPTIEIQ